MMEGRSTFAYIARFSWPVWLACVWLNFFLTGERAGAPWAAIAFWLCCTWVAFLMRVHGRDFAPPSEDEAPHAYAPRHSLARDLAISLAWGLTGFVVVGLIVLGAEYTALLLKVLALGDHDSYLRLQWLAGGR